MVFEMHPFLLPDEAGIPQTGASEPGKAGEKAWTTRSGLDSPRSRPVEYGTCTGCSGLSFTESAHWIRPLMRGPKGVSLQGACVWNGRGETDMDKNRRGIRFGVAAVEKGYITPQQLVEVLRIQVEENLNTKQHRLLGMILLEQGVLTLDEVDDILQYMEG
jgi:hypothetical protein